MYVRLRYVTLHRDVYVLGYVTQVRLGYTEMYMC
jgi:hypothetical protein